MRKNRNLVLAALLVVGYLALPGRMAYAHLSASRTQAAKTSQQAAQIEAHVAQLRALMAEGPRLRTRLAAAQAAFPSTLDASSELAELRADAAKHNLVLTSLSNSSSANNSISGPNAGPSGSVFGNGLTGGQQKLNDYSVQVTVSAPAGSAASQVADIEAWLSDLRGLPRLLTLSKFTLVTSGAATTLQATGTLYTILPGPGGGA